MTDFPCGWTPAKLGDLGIYINGMAFKPSDWTSDGLPIIRIQNLTDSSKPFNRFSGDFDSRYRIRDGDLLISWSASLGAFIWDRGEAILNQHIFRVEVNEERVEKHFLYYLVLHMLDEMARHTHGSTMKHITKRKFEALDVSVPSKKEQRRIVGKIQEVFDRLDEIELIKTKVRVEAAALLSSFLGDLERGSRWPQVPLGELIESRNGKSVRSTGEGGNGYVLTLSAVRDVSLDFSMRKHVELEAKTARTFEVKRNDVFVSRSNTRDLVGLSAVAGSEPQDATIFPDLLIRLRPIDERILPRFLAYALRFPTVRDQIKDRAQGHKPDHGENLRIIVEGGICAGAAQG